MSSSGFASLLAVGSPSRARSNQKSPNHSKTQTRSKPTISSPVENSSRREPQNSQNLPLALFDARNDRLALIKANQKMNGNEIEQTMKNDENDESSNPIDPLDYIPADGIDSSNSLTAADWRSNLSQLINSIRRDETLYTRAPKIIPQSKYVDQLDENVFHPRYESSTGTRIENSSNNSDYTHSHSSVASADSRSQTGSYTNSHNSASDSAYSASAVSSSGPRLLSTVPTHFAQDREQLIMDLRALKLKKKAELNCVAGHRDQLESVIKEIEIQEKELNYLLQHSYKNKYIKVQSNSLHSRIRLESTHSIPAEPKLEFDPEWATKEILLNAQIKIKELSMEKRRLKKSIETLRIESGQLEAQKLPTQRSSDSNAISSPRSKPDLLAAIHKLQSEALEQRKSHDITIRGKNSQLRELEEKLKKLNDNLANQSVELKEKQRISNELEDKKTALIAKIGALKRRLISMNSVNR